MKQKEFMDRLNLCFKTNKKDESLLTDHVRTFRARLLLHTLNTFSKTLSFLDFKDKIVVEKNVPFIIIDNINSQIDSFDNRGSNKIYSQR